MVEGNALVDREQKVYAIATTERLCDVPKPPGNACPGAAAAG